MMNLSINPNTVVAVKTGPTTGKEKTERELKALRESCREFEAILMQQMFTAMRKTIPDDGLLPQDNAMQIYRDMLDMQMARESAKGKGTGIGEAMYNQMKGNIEKKKP